MVDRVALLIDNGAEDNEVLVPSSGSQGTTMINNNNKSKPSLY